jgi:hypothetical protein
MQDHHQRRRLHQPRQVEELVIREADGHALGERTVFPRLPHALQEQFLGPGLDVAALDILGDVVAVHRARTAPDAVEIRLSIRGSGRGGRQIRLAIG